MDFYTIVIKELKDGSPQVRPDWRVGRSKDLMTRGGAFYAIWDEARGLWSTELYDVPRLVDEDLRNFARERELSTGVAHSVATMESDSSKLWDGFQRYLRNSGNNSHNLDEHLTFANTEVKKTDYVSRRLDYALDAGKCDAWDAIVGTLYNEQERAKIEWAIGAVVSGESKRIQKFLVFYGPPGSGKSTILNIIQKLFHGYTAIFDARELAGNNNVFATAAFRSNPLVAIQHDGDLSRIYDNTKLNSIVAHESMAINEKYMKPFEMRSNAFLFMGTNQPVKISDAKSGIIRRLIDVVPTQQVIEHDLYHILMERIDFELGAIAQKCLDRYLKMGKNYYSGYRPTEMMLQTDVFYNFVESCFDIFKAEDGISLKRAWALYKEFCNETGIDKVLPQYKLREELKNYFDEFHERIRLEGVDVRSYYSGFKHLAPPIPTTELPIKTEGEYEIVLYEQPSLFDTMYSSQPAQYANAAGNPGRKWVNVKSTVGKIDTSRLHYVKVPESHIVIDFDLTDENGEKSLELNMEAASKWPATYTELSQSGKGLHLHYTYSGEVEELASIFDVGIEIKTLLGDSSLRRKLTKCNNVTVTPLNGGLPKKEKKMLDERSIKSEKGLRVLIARNLRKEIHPGTKPSVDFILKILDEAYESGLSYDIRDMRADILAFAARSSNHAPECIKMVQHMKFVGQHEMPEPEKSDDPIVFYDVEVYPNLFIVCWKAQGDPTVVRMINPSSEDIEPLFRRKLVGFNNRRYDNHILYARYLGYSLEELYNLSQRIINGGNDNRVLFGEAFNLSYADIYDFSSKKQGLKKFQIELGIHHLELDLPWDEPVIEHDWKLVEEYCVNDVVATEAVFESRKQDFIARQILAELSGLSVNHTTQAHTAKIIFGDDKNPQTSFVYTDLSDEFKGYKFDGKESVYRGETTGEGGYVYSEPGFYTNVALLDVASMHPTSIEQLGLFGPVYTEKFAALKAARMAIKNKDYDKAASLLDGKLSKFVGDDQGADGLSYALKIVINIVYGLTSASFPNPFKDNRNKDNIVAKRGALFMIDLKHAVQEKGFTVAHIKTDSIKIPDATQEIIDFVIDFGRQYGYDFGLEAIYEKFCLINDAVYVARLSSSEEVALRESSEGEVSGTSEVQSESGNVSGRWIAVGAQFQNPYVFKTLFGSDLLTLDDFCETKNVTQGTMYLQFNDSPKVEDWKHVGRTGSFVPVENGGGTLWRVKDDKQYHVTGTKGYKWVEREIAANRDFNGELNVDMTYFEALKASAIKAIENFTSFNDLIA